MRIPRCRATVSEEFATGHWTFREGRSHFSDSPGRTRRKRSSNSPSQETGANCQPQPLSREKEDGSCRSPVLFSPS